MARKEPHGPGIILERWDYAGRYFPGPMVARADSPRRGYFLWATSPVPHYPGGVVFKVCGWPDQSAIGPRRGWRTLREAQAAARAVNDGPLSGFQCSGPFREHGVWHARGFDAWGRHFARAFPTLRAARGFLSSMARGDNRVARY